MSERREKERMSRGPERRQEGGDELKRKQEMMDGYRKTGRMVVNVGHALL